MAKFKKGHKKVGGKKKGSKHKKTIEQELALEFLRKKIRDKWEDLIDTKLELAKGIWVERVIMAYDQDFSQLGEFKPVYTGQNVYTPPDATTLRTYNPETGKLE